MESYSYKIREKYRNCKVVFAYKVCYLQHMRLRVFIIIIIILINITLKIISTIASSFICFTLDICEHLNKKRFDNYDNKSSHVLYVN